MTYVLKTILETLESLQWKFDFQIGIVVAFKTLMQKGEYEHNKVLAKCALAKETWHMAVEKLDMWKCHKFALFAKL